MSILGRTRTRSSGPSSPKAKAKARATPLHTTTSTATTATNTAGAAASDIVSERSKARLTVGGIANMFINLRRLERQSKKPYTITCSSGSQSLTHPHLQACRAGAKIKIPLVQKDTYVCAGNGGVDAVRLLRATRASLMLQANTLGANAVVDESWQCIVHEPKHKPRGQYKVCVQYTASAIATDCQDTLQPVAMNQIKGVPGLMTVISRNGE